MSATATQTRPSIRVSTKIECVTCESQIPHNNTLRGKPDDHGVCQVDCACPYCGAMFRFAHRPASDFHGDVEVITEAAARQQLLARLAKVSGDVLIRKPVPRTADLVAAKVA